MARPRTSTRAKGDRDAAVGRGEGAAELRGYKLHERVGQDELATIFRATHTTLDRPVDVYLLRRTDWVASSRFQLAARLAARLSHPHLLPVIDAGHDERYGDYLVTPQLAGQRLDELLQGGPLDPLLALRIFSQIGAALDYLHKEQVVHRDVQPANIRISSEGLAYLTNLSLAAAPDTPDFSSVDEADYLTPYSAPEQSLRVAEAAPSLDLFSLGALLYHMLSGEVPPDPSVGLPPLGQRDASLAPADRVLARLMANDPQRRYPTAAAATAALRAALRAHVDAASDDMEESQWQSCAEWLDNPLELVLAPLLDAEFLQRSRARADRLHREGALKRLINRWSRQQWIRRKALGSLMQPQQITSYNVYFYELRTAYETRTPPVARTRSFSGGTPPLGGIAPDLWDVPAPSVEVYETVPPQEVVLPNAERLLHCPDCTRGRITCRACNGTGEIPRTRSVTGRDGSTELQQISETCPTCRGYRTQPCPTCEGSGQLVEEHVFAWSRRAKLWQNTDDIADLPEKALAARAVTVFEGAIDPWEPRWHSVEPLRELLQEATKEARAADAETRIIAAELAIRGVPLTEVEYTLNERPYQMLLIGDDEDAEGIDIRSDSGGYDFERIWLYAALAALALVLVLVLFVLR